MVAHHTLWTSYWMGRGVEESLFKDKELVVSASYSSCLESSRPHGLSLPAFFDLQVCLSPEGCVWLPNVGLFSALDFATCQWALLDFCAIVY